VEDKILISRRGFDDDARLLERSVMSTVIW